MCRADEARPHAIQEQQVTTRALSFETSAHSLDAIQRAVYRLSDRLSCDVETVGAAFRCMLHFSSEDESEVEQALADFRNEVLDQVLRERIRAETTEARNLILALAFSQTGLVDAADA
jgi:His-Xaa-Ser system protein HxsD